MTLDSLQATLFSSSLMLPLLGSLIAGALIGAERELSGKPAGLRTHTLVCFGAALMMLIAANQSAWDTALVANTQIITDLARMPHAILTGIGFLGAGVIFREGVSVQGLTTAASLWLTASLGIVYGAGMLELATIGTLIVLAVLVILRVIQKLLPSQSGLRLRIVAAPGFRSTDLIALLRAQGLKPGPIALHRTAEATTLTTRVALPRTGLDSDALADLLHANPHLRQLSLDPID